MKDVDIYKLQSKMKNVLEQKRYEHTLGVAYTAANLAFVFGIDEKKAFIAGLLHDCAKCLSHKKRVAVCKKNNLEITSTEMENPVLLHAKVGAFYSKDKYGICDEDIYNAILYHTTGRPSMSVLEKIIYVADYIEPHRKKLPNLNEIRQVAFKDLDMSVYLILKNSLTHLENSNSKIDSKTRETFEYYDEIINKRGIV